MGYTVFRASDFQLCVVPVPKGYPQSQTHVGVRRVGDIILMTTSPYPNIKRSKCANYMRSALRKASFGLLCNEERAEFFENPCIYSSKDGIHFNLMQSRPLMESPDAYYGLPAYNSDPDLFVDGDEVYILNRVIYRTKLTPGRNRDEYMIRLYLIKGLLDEGRFKFISTNLIQESTELSVSPCITQYNGKFILLQLYTNCYNDGESFDGLRYIKSDSIETLPSNENWQPIEVVTDTWILWHMSLFEYNGVLYVVAACIKRGQSKRCCQLLGKFNPELTRLTIYPTPLSDYNSYRGAAYVDNNGQFVLYNSTVNENIKGGKSCDGREVIIARKPFDEVLRLIKQ